MLPKDYIEFIDSDLNAGKGRGNNASKDKGASSPVSLVTQTGWQQKADKPATTPNHFSGQAQASVKPWLTKLPADHKMKA
jgi:hypothetical protein